MQKLTTHNITYITLLRIKFIAHKLFYIPPKATKIITSLGNHHDFIYNKHYSTSGSLQLD